MPEQYCQSFLDNRNGSTACTVIAACLCQELLVGAMTMPEPGEAPSTEWLNQLVSCMRGGNTLYDDSIQNHGVSTILWKCLGMI